MVKTENFMLCVFYHHLQNYPSIFHRKVIQEVEIKLKGQNKVFIHIWKNFVCSYSKAFNKEHL